MCSSLSTQVDCCLLQTILLFSQWHNRGCHWQKGWEAPAGVQLHHTFAGGATSGSRLLAKCAKFIVKRGMWRMGSTNPAKFLFLSIFFSNDIFPWRIIVNSAKLLSLKILHLQCSISASSKHVKNYHGIA